MHVYKQEPLACRTIRHLPYKTCCPRKQISYTKNDAVIAYPKEMPYRHNLRLILSTPAEFKYLHNDIIPGSFQGSVEN